MTILLCGIVVCVVFAEGPPFTHQRTAHRFSRL